MQPKASSVDFELPQNELQAVLLQVDFPFVNKHFQIFWYIQTSYLLCR